MKLNFTKGLMISFVTTLSLVGCVNSEIHNNSLNQLTTLTEENKDLMITLEKKDQNLEELSNKINQLTSTNTDLLDEIISLEKTLYDFENGASNLLVTIKNHYEKKEYSQAIEAANILHTKFNGHSEDLEGQAIAQKCQAEIDKIESEKQAEAKRLEEEQLKTAKEKAREIIRVSKLSTSEPNSAGGVDLFIGYTNMSDKIIKYATFGIIPYNKVGDQAYCEIRDNSDFRARDEGPHARGEGLQGNYTWYWENAWYCWTIDSLELDYIIIEYTDGTRETLMGDDLEYVQY